MKIDRVDHIVITVRDIEKSLDFYTRILGMEHEPPLPCGAVAPMEVVS